MNMLQETSSDHRQPKELYERLGRNITGLVELPAGGERVWSSLQDVLTNEGDPTGDVRVTFKNGLWNVSITTSHHAVQGHGIDVSRAILDALLHYRVLLYKDCL